MSVIKKPTNLADETACLAALDLHLWVDLTHTEEEEGDDIASREKLFADWKLHTDKKPDIPGG